MPAPSPEILRQIIAIARARVDAAQIEMIAINATPFTRASKTRYRELLAFKNEVNDFISDAVKHLPPPLTERQKGLALSVARILSKMSPDEFYCVMENCSHVERVA